MIEGNKKGAETMIDQNTKTGQLIELINQRDPWDYLPGQTNDQAELITAPDQDGLMLVRWTDSSRLEVYSADLFKLTGQQAAPEVERTDLEPTKAELREARRQTWEAFQLLDPSCCFDAGLKPVAKALGLTLLQVRAYRAVMTHKGWPPYKGIKEDQGDNGPVVGELYGCQAEAYQLVLEHIYQGRAA